MKLIKNFVGDLAPIIQWGETVTPNQSAIENEHIKKINDSINGFSVTYDLTNSPLSRQVANFQGDETNQQEKPSVLVDLVDKISQTLSLNKDNVFAQLIVMNPGGQVKPHYDASVNGYINYKCNISLISPGENIFIGHDKMFVEEGDLYCFEASLYKHWVEKCDARRMLISIGFLLPYSDLGWNENDPRVRLSQRIVKYFQM